MLDEQDVLRWGDIVRIHGVSTKFSIEDAFKEGVTRGLVISKGFTDCDVYYQMYTEFKEVNFYRQSLFQIIPASSFDFHDQLLQDEPTANKDQLKLRAKDEILNLEHTLRNKAGSPVTYGSQALFKHIESEQYLSGVLKAASIGDGGAFKIQLAVNLSSDLLFQIKSHRTYENNENNIYFNDSLQIYHIRSDCYMNFPEHSSESVVLDREYSAAEFTPEDPEYLYYQSRPNIKRPMTQRIHVINENNSKCLWKFIQHCSYKVSLQKEKVKSHDIVYFKHTQHGGLVAATLATNQYYLKEHQHSGEYTQEICFDCFWEIIPNVVNQFGPQNCNLFWARNIVTGQILTYQDYNVSIQSKEAVVGGGFNSEGLINLVCSDRGELLEKGPEIVAPKEESKIIKHYSKSIKKMSFKSVKQLNEDSFIIMKVPAELICDISYVLSSQEAFIKVVEFFSTQMKKCETEDDVRLMRGRVKIQLLEPLLSSLKMLADKLQRAHSDIGSSSSARQLQQILVEIGMAELLIELIYILFRPFKYITDKDKVPHKTEADNMIANIFEFSYRLIQKTVKGYEENRIYFSRWVELFSSHLYELKGPESTYIQNCLVTILQNNPVSIETTIQPKNIKSLVDRFIEQAKTQLQHIHKRYLRLFSTFIRCDKKVINRNQLIILHQFFKRVGNQYLFEFQIIDSGSDKSSLFLKNVIIGVSFNKSQPRTFVEFKQNNPGLFEYMLEYINLFADVCMERKIEAIETVEIVLPLSVVANLFLSDEGIQVMEPFLRIAHHAYINTPKFQPIRRISTVIDWFKERDENEDIQKTERVYEGEKEQEEKKSLKAILQFISEFLIKFKRNDSNLKILETVLSLLKETILLGLWETINQFCTLIPVMIKNIMKIEQSFLFGSTTDENFKLTNIEVIEQNKKSLKEHKSEVGLILDCKIKVTQIFQYMNQMEIDIRLRHLSNFFKGLYEATQNFQVYNFPIIDDCTENDEGTLKRNESAKSQFNKTNGITLLGNSIHKVCQDREIMLRENIWYNKIKQMIPVSSNGDTSKDRSLLREYWREQKDSKEKKGQNDTKKEKSLDEIVMTLLQLSYQNDHHLFSSSLIMLRGIFQQRSSLINKFSELLIRGKGDLDLVYSNLKFMRNKFAMLQNTSIINHDDIPSKAFPYLIFKPYEHLDRKEDNRAGIIQDLFFLARTLKKGVSLKNIESLMEVDTEVFNGDKVYHFYNQRERNNELFQQLNLAQGIYIPLIEYIRIVTINTTVQLTEIHRRLLTSIFQYLTLLCFNNIKAKHIFMQYLYTILGNLTRKVGAASLLYEICINNKILVNSESDVQLIITYILQACITLHREAEEYSSRTHIPAKNLNYQKSKILYSLKSILIFNEEGHRRNQQTLMNKLQDNHFKRLLYTDVVSTTTQGFVMNCEEAYVATFFELFSALVQSKNLINIGKLENLHPYTYLLECLAKTKSWQIRRTLRSYTNRLYYVNKDRDIFLFQKFIQFQFLTINKQLQEIIKMYKDRMVSSDLKIRNGIRFSFAQSQISLLLMQILITLREMFSKVEFIKLLKSQIKMQEKNEDEKKELHIRMISLLKKLGCINILFPRTKSFCTFIKEIKAQLSPLLEQFHVRYLERQCEPTVNIDMKEQNIGSSISFTKPQIYDQSRSFFRNLIEMIREVKQKQKIEELQIQQNKRKNQVDVSEAVMKKNYIDTIFTTQDKYIKPIVQIKAKKEEQHYQPHLHTANSKMFKVLAKPELDKNMLNQELNQQLNEVKEMLTDSPVFKKFVEDQFLQLVTVFTRIDETSKNYYRSDWTNLKEETRPIFSSREILTSCFNLIIQHSEAINDKEKIFIVKLARCYITQAVESGQAYKLPVDKWSADYYTDEQSGHPLISSVDERTELVKRQHQVEICGGSKFLISIFQKNLFNHCDLLNQTLLLGVAYLFNGNTHCQNSLLAELKADTSNLTCLSLKKLIKSIGDFVINVRNLKDIDKKKNSFQFNIVDAYDFFDVRENGLIKLFGHRSDKKELATQENYQQALCRTFRFLQLFCENNNCAAKSFIWTQTDLNGDPKTNTINFIAQATSLLRQIFKIMSNKVVNIPPSIMDFINEVTQIPCLDNQISLISSTFFEDISYMADFFKSKQNLEQRKFSYTSQGKEDPLTCLMSIYEKGVNLALSNFQGNSDIIYDEFLNKCQPKFLWIVIKQNLLIILKDKTNDYSASRAELEDKIFNPDKTQSETDQQYKDFIVEEQLNLILLREFNFQKIQSFIKKKESQAKIFRDEFMNILNVIFLLKKIEDYATHTQILALQNKENPEVNYAAKALKAKEFKDDLINEAKLEYGHIEALLHLFSKLVLSIEVSSDNSQEVGLQHVYFPKHPVFSYLASQTRDTIMMDVKRQNRRDKLNSLFGYYDDLKDEIEWNYDMKYYHLKLGQRELCIPITSELINSVREYARNISYVICFFMFFIIVVEHDNEEQTSYFTVNLSSHQVILKIFCFLQLLLTLLFVVLWLLMRLPLCMKQYYRNNSEKEEEEEAEKQEEEITEMFVRGNLVQTFANILVKLKGIRNAILRLPSHLYQYIMQRLVSQVTEIGLIHRILEKTYYPVASMAHKAYIGLIAVSTYETGFLSIVIFLAVSIFSNILSVKWYTLHIFDYFVTIQLLSNVFKSIIKNIKDLLLLSVFAGCFIFVFNVLSLDTYASVIYQDPLPSDSCEDIFNCVLTSYTSGAVGEDMDQLYFGRFAFDTVYVVFMEMLFSNLVAGMMIDTFSELRQEDQMRNIDKSKVCYICSMTKSEMQKRGTTFKKHKEKHLLWNYLFYKYCLSEKDPTDYSGLEYDISTKISQENVQWFPDNDRIDISGENQVVFKHLKNNIEEFGKQASQKSNLEMELIKRRKIFDSQESQILIDENLLNTEPNI